MEDNRRVYPRGSFPGKTLSYLMLFLSAVIVLSGLLWRGDDERLTVELRSTATPAPSGEAFDDARETREWTLPGATWYALQFGAFESEEAARQVAESYYGRGAAGFLWHDTRYRVLAALYRDKIDAQIVRDRLHERNDLDSYLFEITLPALTLRLTGLVGQLDALQAALGFGLDCVNRLQALALRLDMQEASAEQTLKELAMLSAEAGEHAARLAQRFPEPRHQTVEDTRLSLEACVAYAGALSQDASAVQMAASVKHETLQMLHRMVLIYEGVQNPA